MKIQDVIASACEELNCSYEANALWFEVLINQAVRSHKTSNKFQVKTVEEKSMDFKVQLPKDFSKLINVFLCSAGEIYCPDIDFTIQNDCIVFDSNLGMSDGTKIGIKYLGLKTDDEGTLILPDDWERMLVAYIGWKYSRRYAREFGVAIMQNYQREYQTQKLANV